MIDFFGHAYEVGDEIYYVILSYSRKLHAKHGVVLKVNSTSLTVQTKQSVVVVQRPRRHVNITKLKNNEVSCFKYMKEVYEND